MGEGGVHGDKTLAGLIEGLVGSRLAGRSLVSVGRKTTMPSTLFSNLFMLYLLMLTITVKPAEGVRKWRHGRTYFKSLCCLC